MQVFWLLSYFHCRVNVISRFPLVVVYRLPYLLRSKKFHTSFIYTVKPCLKATSVIRSPRYYSHFFWPPVENRHTFSLKKKTLIRPPGQFFWPISDRINGDPLYKNYFGQFLSACFLGIFTLYRKGFAPAPKPYRIGLLFTHNNGDFGAISVTERSCTEPCRS